MFSQKLISFQVCAYFKIPPIAAAVLYVKKRSYGGVGMFWLLKIDGRTIGLMNICGVLQVLFICEGGLAHFFFCEILWSSEGAESSR